MKNPIKNQGGSALAYVLIFSVIIMVLVVGLLTVAQSGISFTQQTVESRQAYIDAKSVIEYGKIEINDRGKWLEVENGILEDLYDQLAAAIAAKESTTAIQSAIDAQIQKIHDYMTATFYIGGTAGNVVTTVCEISDEAAALGVLTVTEESDPDSTNVQKLNYIFDIQTQNLRRSLDYQTSLNYTQPEYNDDGTITEPTFNCSDALATQIKKEGSKLACVIQKEGNEKEAFDSSGKSLTMTKTDLNLAVGKDKDNPNAAKFDWIQGYTLNLTAKNLCFVAPFPTNDVYQAEFNVTATDTIRIKKDYIQNNNDVSKTCTFEAQDIVFEGDITLNNAANLQIKCKNLWIKGDVNLANGSGSLLKIEAENIIIGDYVNHTKGNINIGSAGGWPERTSQIQIKKVSTYDCQNLWVRGDVNLVPDGGTNTALIVDAGNIYVGDYQNNSGGKVTIGDKSQLDLNCSGNIMIRDDLALLTNSAAPENNLSAKNIAIGTASNTVGLTVKHNTVINWNCENFWLYGNISTTSNGSTINFNNINYLKTGDIILENGAKLTVTGAAGKNNNIMICGNIRPPSISTHTLKLNLSNLAYCICDSLELDQGCEATISSNFVGFRNKYNQMNGNVTIKDAENVIFSGTSFSFGGDGVSSAYLTVAADNIYIDTETINFRQYWDAQTVGFNYSGKNGGSTTNLSLKKEISWKPKETTYTIESGKYGSVSGSFPQASSSTWLYNQVPGTYTAPSWTQVDSSLLPSLPTAPVAPVAGIIGGGTGSGGTVSGGFISNGSEKYY
jgi:hypothetical protein